MTASEKIKLNITFLRVKDAGLKKFRKQGQSCLPVKILLNSHNRRKIMSNEGYHAYSKRKTVAKTELWLNLDMQKRLSILTMALDQGNNSIAILNRSGITIYVNPKLLSVYNTSFDKVIGKNWISFLSLHSGLRKNIVDIRETVLKKWKVWTGEVSDISHAGETIWRRSTITPIKGKNGEIDFIIYSSEDITKDKLAALVLSENEKRLQMALENANDGLFDWNIKSGKAYYSPRYFTMLGFRPDELPHNADAWIGLIHPDDRKFVNTTVQEYMDGKRKQHEIEYRMRTKDAQWRWVLSRGGIVEWDDKNKPIRMIGTHVDITEKIYAKAALKQSETLFRTAIDSIPFDLFILDEHQYYIIQNKVGRETWGNIIGKRPEDVAENKETLAIWKENNRRVLAGETIKGEITARVKGEDRYFYNIISPIVRHITGKNTKKDTVTGILGINIDITNRKQMEEKLRQSEKMEAVGQLAGGIAHDFNNQLAGIMCYADVTRDFYPDDPEFIKCIDEIKVIVRRAADLTSQLLAFARKGNNQSVPVEIHVIINDICTILSRSIDKTIRIKQHLEAMPSTILGDLSQIENALLNVAINARDAMKNGGELIFATEIVELTEDTLPQYHNEIIPGAFIKIAVTDTGCGIEEPVLSHMFEPFFTTKPAGKGTGMGLAAVYGTLQTHHGGITIQTEAGKGSTFELFFPLFNGEKNEEDKKSGTLPIKGKGHILLVEDDKAIRTSTTLNLERLGYSVVSCEDGHQAVAEYCKNPGKFDIVILDIILPGINGMTVYDSMVSCNPDVKVIFCSGYNPDDRIQQLLTSMYVDFLHKPYTIKALSQKVKELILI